MSKRSSELLRLLVSSGEGTRGDSPGSRVVSGGLGGGLAQRRAPGSPPASVRMVTGCSQVKSGPWGCWEGAAWLREDWQAGQERASTLSMGWDAGQKGEVQTGGARWHGRLPDTWVAGSREAPPSLEHFSGKQDDGTSVASFRSRLGSFTRAPRARHPGGGP